MAKRPTPDEQKSLFEATIAAEGVTTVIGNVGGTTFEDGALAGSGVNSFVSMLAIIHPGEAAVDSRDITAFNNATGEVTVASAFKGGQVAAGTPYKIVTFRFVPAEVAALQADVTALMADVGDASGATLGSLLNILGDPAQSFLAMIGYEGATSLANKLTAARAALLDEITAGRMAELDAANIPADIDTLLTRLNAARAALLDEITAGRMSELDAANLPADIDTLLTRVTAAVALASVCTEARLAQLDPANIPATLTAIAGYIDTEVAAILAAVVTGVADILADTADMQPKLGTPAADLAADIAAVKAVVDAGGYFGEPYPIKMNCTQTIGVANADKDFIPTNATGASGLISTDDAKVQKVFLLIIGRAVNIYAGTNALDCTTATWNQWQMNLDGGAYGDLTNEEADGQMLDNDWRCPVEGAIHPFTFMFDVTAQVTNIDGKIGVRLAGAQSEQDSLITTIDAYLRVLWKL